MATGLFKVYRSSAGSGKTFTLVREYLRLSLSTEDPSKYRQILAITFTNKAATEMKERVLSSLKGFSKLETDPEFDEVMFNMLRAELQLNKEELQKRASACFEHMLHHYSDVSISTIDKFVHSVIRSFARDLQLNPDFEVEIDMAGLLERAIDELLSLVGLDEHLSVLLVNFAQSRMEEESSWDVKSELQRFAKHLHKEESGYFLSLIHEMNGPAFEKLRLDILKHQSQVQQKLSAKADDALALIEQHGTDPKQFNYGAVPKYLSNLSSGVIAPPNSRITDSLEAGYLGKKSDKGESRLEMESLGVELLPMLEEIIDEVNREYSKSIIARAVLKGIYPLATLKRIEDQIEEIKSREGILPISDFNKMVSSVVAENPAPFIYERIAEKFNHFLIDEFQDTSVLQWQNFLPLVENSLSKSKFNMLVGDGKQAIYRWRSGEVEQFDKLPEIYKHQDKSFIKDKEKILKYNYEEARLNANFRSKNELIDFNNELFTFLSNELTGEYQSIYQGHEQEKHRGDGGLVSVDFIPKGSEDIEGQNLQILLDNINSAQEDSFPFSSMAVICRKNKQAKIVAQFLLENDVPVISSESLMLTQDASVELVISTLKILNHPDDTSAAISIIKNYHVITNNPDRIDGSLWKYRKENEKNRREVWIDIHGFFKDCELTELLTNNSEDGLYESFERIVRGYKLDRQANVFIEFLAEQLHQFSVKRRNDIDSFLDWWKSHGEKISIRMAKGLNAVTIITIHKSKGLEYPVVFLPFLDWKSNTRDETWIELDDSFQPLKAALVGLNKEFEHTEYASIYEEEKNKKVLDDLNLLYVACTRARDRLYVTLEEGKSPSDKIARFLDSKPENSSDDKWNIGLAHKFKTENTIQRDSEMKRFPSRALYSQLKLSLDAPRDWEVDQPLDARERGTLFHEILENYSSDSSLDEIIQNTIDNPSLQKKWKERILSCLALEKVKHWFQQENTAHTELSFLDIDGNLYRPDRVVITDQAIEVVDYKTGEENEKYANQLRTYMKLAAEIYRQPVKGYLLYLDQAKVVEVFFSADLFSGNN